MSSKFTGHWDMHEEAEKCGYNSMHDMIDSLYDKDTIVVWLTDYLFKEKKTELIYQLVEYLFVDENWSDRDIVAEALDVNE
tara:strand:- start:3255 stop:3497 length:243 start_codon:yes stop_codon:yes gene_type:complete